MVIKDDLSSLLCCSPSAGEYLSPHGNCHLCDVTCLQCTGPEKEDCTSCSISWWRTSTCTPNMHACMPHAGDGACIWHFLISKHQKIISCVHPLLPPAGSSTMADVATGVRGGVLQRGTSAPPVTTPVRSAPTKALITAPAVIQVDAQPLGKGQNMHMYSHPKRSKRLFLPLKNRDVSFSYFSNNWTI